MQNSKVKKTPDFLVLGVPKAGTTSLYEYIRGHPQIYLPEIKELHFFTYDLIVENNQGPRDVGMDSMKCTTNEQYFEQFRAAETGQLIGEVSTSYLFFSERLHKLKDFLSDDIKVVILLRDPLERAYSNYKHLVRNKRETLSFIQALKAEKARLKNKWGDFWGYAEHSKYYEDISKVFELFSPQQVKIMLFEDLTRNTPTFLRTLFEFLEVDANYYPENAGIAFNKGGSYKKTGMVNWMLEPSPLRKLLKRLIPHSALSALRKRRDLFIAKNTVTSFPPLNTEEKQFLINLLRNDMLKMKESYQVDYLSANELTHSLG